MIYYAAIIFITIFSMIIMIAMVRGNNILPQNKKHGFILTFSMIMTVALAECLGVFLDGVAPGTRVLHIGAKILEFSLTPVIPVACAGTIHSVRRAKKLAVPLLIHAILECLSARFGFIFYVDAANVYHRAKFYWLYIAVFLSGIVFLFVESFSLSRQYQNRNRHVLTMILTFLIAGTGLQIVNRTIRVDWISVAIASMLFYTYYSELIQQMDALTMLLNRRSYENRLTVLNEPAMILIFDVDEFKSANDSFGHAFGDYCLESIGREIKNVYGRTGLCYRTGGDEFCTIMTRRFRSVEALNTAFFHRLEQIRSRDPDLPYVSVGFTLYDPSRESVQDAVRRADANMYEYKKSHRAKAL